MPLFRVSWRVVVAVTAVMAGSPAIAPAATPLACYASTYDEWLGERQRNAVYIPAPWRYEVPVEISRQYWAVYWSFLQPRDYDFPRPDNTFGVSFLNGRCPDFTRRWLDEAREYGDIVIPIPPIPGEFIVFHAGTPADSVELVTRNYYRDTRELAPEAVAAIMESVHAVLGG